MAISWLLYTNLRNKTKCVGLFAQTYKTKNTTDRSFLRDRKDVSISILFQKVCLSWKLSPIINGGGWGVGGGIRMSWVEKNPKIN